VRDVSTSIKRRRDAKRSRTFDEWEIAGLVVIGGNGSQTGANALSGMVLLVVGVASTIDTICWIGDDDRRGYGAEHSAGSDRSAEGDGVVAWSRVLVEVMERKCGYLALMAAIAGGAELVVLPEVEMSPLDVRNALSDAYKRGKQHAVAVVAEGSNLRRRGAGNVLQEA